MSIAGGPRGPEVPVPWGSSPLPPLPLPVPTRACWHSPFPVPPLSSSANFFTGAGCQPQPLHTCPGLLKKWLIRQDPGLGFARMEHQAPFSAGRFSGMLWLPRTPWRRSVALAPGVSALGTRVSGRVMLGCAGQGVPLPPRRRQLEAPALWRGVPAPAAVPGSLAAGARRGRISSLCSRSNCSDGDLG